MREEEESDEIICSAMNQERENTGGQNVGNGIF